MTRSREKYPRIVGTDSRQVAFLVLKAIHQRGAFADIALDQGLQQSDLSQRDRALATELVYGAVRRQRTLDALIDQLGKKKAHQQPLELRLVLHLGLYQLRYLSQIPPHAVVDTTVALAKQNRLGTLSGVVNGILRQYIRLAESVTFPPPPPSPSPSLPSPSLPPDSLQLPPEPVQRLGILHSYPDWIVQTWYDQLGDWTEVESLCEWMNLSPAIDLRINPLKTSLEEVETASQTAGVAARPVPHVPQALRLIGNVGPIQNLPGFREGWWTVQDASAQLVGHLLDPQPGETVIDACAAPGGKTTHMAELMSDRGLIWACDRYESRLKRLKENCDRLQLHAIRICIGDSRDLSQFRKQADRVLVDAPCSGLGTLHRHADARWRQTPETVAELAKLQAELLQTAATCVKPGGVLVYATCTLHPTENEAVVRQFLQGHPGWRLDPPQNSSVFAPLVTPEGWIKVWPHRHQMDGFFMVRLKSD